MEEVDFNPESEYVTAATWSSELGFLAKSFNFSGPWFPHLQNGNTDAHTMEKSWVP